MKALFYAAIILLIPAAPYLGAFIQLSNYYRHYLIQIEYWATPAEMQALCTDYFIKYLLEMLLLLAFSIPLILLSDLMNKAIDKAKSFKQKRSLNHRLIWIKTVTITVMLYTAFFGSVNVTGEWISAIILSALVGSCLLIACKNLKELQIEFGLERRIISYTIFLSLTLFFFHSTLQGIMNQEWVAQDNRRVTVKTKIETIDSLKFLGKTSQAYFFVKGIKNHQYDSTKTYIIRSEDVLSVRLTNGKWTTVIY